MPAYRKALEKYLRDLGYDPREIIDPSRPPVKGYKLFRQREGELYPLFVNADQPVPMGEWLAAETGPLTAAGKVKSKIGDLAYRPGWHAGDLPIATHIGGKATEFGKIPTKPNYRPDEQVWAEIEMPGAVDWQRVALDRAERSKAGNIIPRTAHITDRLPTGGFYRYKTNPNMTGEWLIGGEMKVNRLLEDAEVRDINRAAGVEDLPRLRNLQRRKGYVPAAAGGAIGLGALADPEEAQAMPVGQAAIEDPDVDEILYNAQARPWEGSYDRYIADDLWTSPEALREKHMAAYGGAQGNWEGLMEMVDYPLRALLGGAQLVAGLGSRESQRAAQETLRRPSEDTLFDFGAWVQDIAAQNPSTRSAAPALGTAAYTLPQFLSPF